MGILTWIKSRMSNGEITVTPTDGADFFSLLGETYIRELAFWSAVNMIANSISKCEFKTFLNGKEVKDREYYLFNIEPNKNQNSSAFIHQWISQLYRKNECLIIEENGQLLVADSYIRKPYALLDDVFTGVTVGDFTFNRSYTQADVLYFKLSEQDMRKVTAGLYESYGKLITYGMKSYQKSRGNRGTLNISTLAQGKIDYKETVEKLLNERFKTFFNAENAVLPLFDGYSYTDIGSKTYSNEGTRDIRAMMDDISDFTAKGFGIPPALLRGDVAGIKDALESFLTFCVDPLCDMLQEEINRKRSGYAGFKAGTYLQIDTKAIKHVDLLSVSTAIDKLVASGAFCINDIRKLVGEEPIDEPWAWQHFMTKNYSTVADLLAALEGGETNEKL
ncbi:phage portal protein [Desulfosporosinus nitroreducens]|uniref:phage portal protein n=1 Tax=Desulfosporosinus nitroreducens TaxID=2018668 RepID=UPI00207CB501|nr:phage portal protein [Desulfosporosinus nitroreducens]